MSRRSGVIRQAKAPLPEFRPQRDKRDVLTPVELHVYSQPALTSSGSVRLLCSQARRVDHDQHRTYAALPNRAGLIGCIEL